MYYIAGAAVIGAGASIYSANKAAKASKEAAETSVGSQSEALQYLKEREEIPSAIRDEALTELAGLYGIGGDEGTRDEFVGGLKDDPFYEMLVEEGTEGALSGLAATGKLRSGARVGAEAEVKERALRSVYGERVRGLTGLATLPSYTGEIAEGIGGIGETRGAGQIAAARAQQKGVESGIKTGLSTIGMGLKYGVI